MWPRTLAGTKFHTPQRLTAKKELRVAGTSPSNPTKTHVPQTSWIAVFFPSQFERFQGRLLRPQPISPVSKVESSSTPRSYPRSSQGVYRVSILTAVAGPPLPYPRRFSIQIPLEPLHPIADCVPIARVLKLLRPRYKSINRCINRYVNRRGTSLRCSTQMIPHCQDVKLSRLSDLSSLNQ